MAPDNRVLGVIRPTAEVIGHHTQTRQIGILATTGTVVSGSYLIEVHRSFPELKVFQQACPMWVPMVENNEYDNEGADYYIKKYIDALRAQSPDIDTVLMACTHYPLLVPKIKKFWPEVNILSQGLSSRIAWQIICKGIRKLRHGSGNTVIISFTPRTPKMTLITGRVSFLVKRFLLPMRR